MKILTDVRVPFGAILLLAGAHAPIAFAQGEDLTGTWSCTFAASEEGMTMNGNYEYVFNDDQTFAAVGEMSIELALPDFSTSMTLELDMEGTWRLDSMTLYETLIRADVRRASEEASPIEQMVIPQIQAEFAASVGQEEDLTIVSLTSTSMTIDDGSLHECDRT